MSHNEDYLTPCFTGKPVGAAPAVLLAVLPS